MSARLAGGMIAVALTLGGIVIYQAVAPAAVIPDPPASVARASTLTLPSPYTPSPEGAFEIINVRALFDPARGPVAEPPELGEAGVTPPPLTLVGVAIGGRNSVALLRKPNVKEAISLHIGQSVDGWELTRIEPTLVVLKAGVNEFTVRIRAAAGIPQPLGHGRPPVAGDAADH